MFTRITFSLLLTAVAILALSCKSRETKAPRTGEELAKIYCGTCHLYPEPGLLNKAAWEKRVLPAMAEQVGINFTYKLPMPNSPSPIHLSTEEFQAIENFYAGAAPDSLPKQDRPPLTDTTRLFHAEAVTLSPTSVPFTSYLKIDPGNHLVYAHSGEDSSFTVYDDHLKVLNKFHIGGVVVDVDYEESLTDKGDRSGVLTKIGYMNPNDLLTGSVEKFQLAINGRTKLTNQPLLSKLPRPVQAIRCDLTGSGKPQYLICGFGHLHGELALEEQQSDGKFTRKILRPLPGAIKAYIHDFDGDGLKDVMVLMAQAQEGIYLLHNNGDGTFKTTPLLEFPPVYGSCYFELDDFNNDGAPDILYAAGDNADQSSGILKAFHGVYIFMNDGKLHFTQKYFFPIHGCYKAMARDFDKDGDLDIAAISFFPDHKNQPQESFVYLEQEKPMEFKPYIIPQYNEGSWILMDVDDLDGDGDPDIVLGSLVPPLPGRGEAWINAHPKGSVGILLLRNKTIVSSSTSR